MDHPRNSDRPFFLALGLLGGSYVALIAALLVADVAFTTPGHLLAAFRTPEIRYAVRLSLLSSSLTALLALWVAIPIAYLLSRTRFPGRGVVEILLDVPLMLPPTVLGLSLLILFRTPPGRAVEMVIPFTYAVPGVVLAQSLVAFALAVRSLRVTFERIPLRHEQVAWTLGCGRAQAFWRVVLPEARRGLLAAGTLAWARALGDFGPVLVFAGATRFRTEVLPTTIYLELSVGNLEAAVAVALFMVLLAGVVLTLVRVAGLETGRGKP